MQKATANGGFAVVFICKWAARSASAVKLFQKDGRAVATFKDEKLVRSKEKVVRGTCAGHPELRAEGKKELMLLHGREHIA